MHGSPPFFAPADDCRPGTAHLNQPARTHLRLRAGQRTLALTVAALMMLALVSLGRLEATETTTELVQREITRVLRQSQPEGVITVLTLVDKPLELSANAMLCRLGSTTKSPTQDDPAAVDRLTAAESDDDAAKIVRAIGLTHIALARIENFGAEFSRRTKPALLGAAPQTTFAQRLRARTTIPVWLEPILYRPPSLQSPALASCEISLFKINFNQTPAEACYRLGLLMLSKGKDNAALENFTRATQINPADAGTWFRRAEILLRQHRTLEALDSFTQGINVSPKNERYKLYTQAGLAFENAGEIKTAVSLYRRAVGEDMTNTIALNNLAWRLATSHDAMIRDPALALSFAQAADLAEPDSPENLDTLAAALAENGRFEEALQTAQAAIALAQKAGDETQAKLCADHAAFYQNHRAWRQ